MPSLLQKLFDTMPLAGLRNAPLGHLAGHFQVFREPVTLTADAPIPTEEQVNAATHGDTVPIWGWTSSATDPNLTNITCRVRDDDFKQYVVLENLEFGSTLPTAPTEMKRSVRVTHRGRVVDLPLEEMFRLLTFATAGGRLAEDESPLFPLKSLHDPSLVHVYAYDVPLFGADPRSLKDGAHPERAKIDAFLERAMELNSLAADDARLLTALWDDELWSPDDGTIVDTYLGESYGSAELDATPTRIVVAICATFCKERDDYVMGHMSGLWLVGMGRLYPQVLTLSSRPLERVESAIRFARPTSTQVVGGHVCGCGEMLSDIGTGFWTDTNAGNLVRANPLGNPVGPDALPFWEEIFNYYLTDPDREPEILGKPLKFVHPYGGAKQVSEGAVYRWAGDDGYIYDRVSRIERHERQGAFDNIHLAPRMRVKQTFECARVLHGENDWREVPFDREAWKMDRVVMAPFCAHDCFHMHTRWGAALGAEKHTKGFSAAGAYRASEAPMVPLNHAVYVTTLGPNKFIYSEDGYSVSADVWDIGCYPGCGYALTVGGALEDVARKMVSRLDRQVLFPHPDLSSWAIFYWHLRYHFAFTADGLVVEDAVLFQDRAEALRT